VTEEQQQTLGRELFEARMNQRTGELLTDRFPALTVEEAYQIQAVVVGQYLANGYKVTGKKIGLTSKAMQDMFGVREPDYGTLFDRLAYNSGDEVPAGVLQLPKVEGEIAFVLKQDLKGRQITARDVLDATAYVVGAIEIVDSRYPSWKMKLADTVADNGSQAAYVLENKRCCPDELDLRLLGMAVERNGQVINTGAGAAVMGHPANCVAWLANKMNACNTPLQAGDVILSGALAGAIDARPGDYFSVQFGGLGEVCISFGRPKESLINSHHAAK